MKIYRHYLRTITLFWSKEKTYLDGREEIQCKESGAELD